MGTSKNPCCHPEQSEGSRGNTRRIGILRCAQNDRPILSWVFRGALMFYFSHGECQKNDDHTFFSNFILSHVIRLIYVRNLSHCNY
jgi:hypothetical protein